MIYREPVKYIWKGYLTYCSKDNQNKYRIYLTNNTKKELLEDLIAKANELIRAGYIVPDLERLLRQQKRASAVTLTQMKNHD